MAQANNNTQSGSQTDQVRRVTAVSDYLSWLIVISFVIVAILVLLGYYYIVSGSIKTSPENAGLFTAVAGLIGTIVGYFFANAQQVVSFYFGSSAGSAAKTDHIAQTTADAIAALGQAAAAPSPTAAVAGMKVTTPEGVQVETAAGDKAGDTSKGGIGGQNKPDTPLAPEQR